MVSDIKDYILRSRESGISDNVIKTALVNMGHSRSEIEQIYSQILGVRPTESENYFTPNNNIQFGNQPAVATPEQVAQKEQAVEQGKKKTKKTLVIVGIIILLLAGLGSGLAYYNFLQNRPDNVLKKFNMAWPSISSFRNTVNIAALITPEDGAVKQIELKADFKGSFDFSTSTGPKTSGEFIISSQEFANFSPIGLSFVFANKNIYLRSWDFSKFPFMDLSSLNGVWIMAGTNSEEYEDSSPFGIVPDFERAEGVGERFRTAMQDPPIKFIGELPSEVINNISTYHYLFEIDQIKFEEFAGKIGGLTPDEIAKVREKAESKYSNIATSTLELWIYKGSYMPAKFSILLEGKGIGSFIDSVKIDHIFNDINTALTIPEPNNSRKIQEIFEELANRIAVNIQESISSSSIIISSTSTAPTSTIPR